MMIRNFFSCAVVVLGIITVSASIAAAQDDNAPLKKDDVVKTVRFMKQTNSSDQEIAQVVSRAGVDFKPSRNDEKELRQAGASDAVIAAVKGGYRGEEPPTKEEPPRTTENKIETEEPKTKPPKEIKPPKRNEVEQNETAPPNNERKEPPRTKQDTGMFKVGDRVEVDTFMRGDYPGAEQYAKWRPGKIIRIENPQDRLAYYVVEVEEDGHEMQIRFRTRDVRWIRAPQE